MNRMISAGIITVSDTRTIETDSSGKKIIELLEAAGWNIEKYSIVVDVVDTIYKTLKEYVDLKINVIFTTGGTGLTKRDVTPEATEKIIKINVPGIAENIRTISMKYTDRGMLSRGLSGICDDCLIINLPGSLKAVSQILPEIIDAIAHGVELIHSSGGSSDLHN